MVLCFSDFYGLPFAFSRYQTHETRVDENGAPRSLLDAFIEKERNSSMRDLRNLLDSAKYCVSEEIVARSCTEGGGSVGVLVPSVPALLEQGLYGPESKGTSQSQHDSSS